MDPVFKRDDASVAGPMNVDGVRRLLNVSPESMSDDDIRRVLVRWACDLDADEPAVATAANVRRFADAINRLVPGP